MKRLFWLLFVAATSCSVGPQVPKGQLTVEGRGAEALTNQGDPLMVTGQSARKVPVDFAKGYVKGISDQVKRTYWDQQANQRASDDSLAGKIRYYNASLPERPDENGIIRVQRDVVIPIVE